MTSAGTVCSGLHDATIANTRRGGCTPLHGTCWVVGADSALTRHCCPSAAAAASRPCDRHRSLRARGMNGCLIAPTCSGLHRKMGLTARASSIGQQQVPGQKTGCPLSPAASLKNTAPASGATARLRAGPGKAWELAGEKQTSPSLLKKKPSSSLASTSATSGGSIAALAGHESGLRRAKGRRGGGGGSGGSANKRRLD